MAKSKIPPVTWTLALLLSLLATLVSPKPTDANPDEVQWSRVNIPTEGEAGD
ncbi:MAG: hypothetical protein V1932_06925 [Chloroflexota bacterium]